jgi:hypothetical protein
MPASGCEEIETAIRHGINEDDIFCFDGSAAVIATSKWRKAYPNIMFAACSLDELSEKIFKHKKPVSVANFDLCGNVAGDVVDQVDAFLCSGIMKNRCAFAINIAKGREGKTLLKVIQSLNLSKNIDCDRMAAFCSISRFFVQGGGAIKQNRISCLKQDNYREHKTPMSWAVFMARELNPLHYRKSFIERARFLRDGQDNVRFNRLIDLASSWMQVAIDGSVNMNNSYLHDSFAKQMARQVPLSNDFLSQVKGVR